ncbi:NUDIX domain-containing protein [Novosphingobium sp.]|uniref:NUDIX domain-containing protein n=1 Tax=Novosphingobium sp. TaxID=1874826 RepID=UPI002627F0E4|nr:NUDIX domain-containing protein [Novosphingobium sp.]
METHDIEPENWLAKTTPAATIVIFRRDWAGGAAQLLLVERNASLKFAGGATVFPGGKVDAADRALAERLVPTAGLDHEDLAARVAAVRETLEETGLVVGIEGVVDGAIAAQARRMLLEVEDLALVLEAFGWSLAPERLVPFARWWPKHRTERIFDTRFYLADLGTGAVDIEVDATENRHMFWASAQEALDLAEQGKIKIIFPTRRNLERLALFTSFEETSAHALATPVDTISPFMEERGGERWLMIPDGLGYPVVGEPLESAQRG